VTDDLERTGRARRAAELALVRVCNNYGGLPNFVLIGGLVPAMLCSHSGRVHAGTTDVDVQVDLEIAQGAEQAERLERALLNSDFRADGEREWRWETTQGGGYKAVIKFELLADREDTPQGATVHFDGARALGAANLRGTGYATVDYAPRALVAYDQGARIAAEVNVTGLAGFLLAKTAAAHGRHKPKDFYDIAFVLLHHNEIFEGGATQSPDQVVLQRIGAPVELRSAIQDLAANFADGDAQGVRAYVEQMLINNPGEDPNTLATDAELAVGAFTASLLAALPQPAD